MIKLSVLKNHHRQQDSKTKWNITLTYNYPLLTAPHGASPSLSPPNHWEQSSKFRTPKVKACPFPKVETLGTIWESLYHIIVLEVARETGTPMWE